MKRTHIIALLFIIIAIGAIISTVYNASTYATFAEARQHPGRDYHIIGTLDTTKPIEETLVSGQPLMSFYMADAEGESQKILYQGPKPQDFEKSDQVVLIGRFENGKFMASSLLLKCPSKYNPEDLQPEAFETREIGTN